MWASLLNVVSGTDSMVGVRVWLGLGSNIDAETNIRSAVTALQQAFGELQISPVYESDAVGFDGDRFINLVVGIKTSLGINEVNSTLKQIEDSQGRSREGDKFSARTLDIDILTFADLDLTEDGVNIPRHEILTYAFVLRPLADVAPEEIHPHLGLSYRTLWEGFDQASQPMRELPDFFAQNNQAL